MRTGKLNNGDHKSCGCMRAERLQLWWRKCRIVVRNGKKPCSKCKRTLPVAAFCKNTRSSSGLAGRCRDCSWHYILKKYGMTAEAAKQLRAAQGARCAICCKKRKLHIDHDHKTGRVRGLLCGNCNRALGLLQDDTGRIKKMVAYLRRSLK